METLSSYFWTKIDSPNDNALKRTIYDVLSKFYGCIIEFDYQDDTFIICVWCIILVVYVVPMFWSIYNEELMPLDKIRNQVEASALALENIAKALKVIKEVRYKSLTYEDYMAIRRNKESAMRLLELTRPKPEPEEPEAEKPLVAVAPKPPKARPTRSTPSIWKKSAARRMRKLRQTTPPTTCVRFDHSSGRKKSNPALPLH